MEEQGNHRLGRVLKVAAFGIAGVASAAWASYEVNAAALNLTDIRALLFAIGAVTLWCAVTLTVLLAVPYTKAGALILFLEAAAMLVFLESGRASLYPLFGAGLLFVFLFFAFWKWRRELEEFLKVRFFRTGIRAAASIVTGFSLFIAMYGLTLLDLSQFSLSPGFVDTVINAAAPIVTRFSPGFSPTLPIDDVLRSVAERATPPETPNRNTVIAATVEEFKIRLARLTHADIETGERIDDYLVRIGNDTLEKFSGRSRVPFLIGAGIVLFLAAKGTFFFVSWLSVLLAFVIYQFLLVFGVIYIGFENRNKEVILLK